MKPRQSAPTEADRARFIIADLQPGDTDAIEQAAELLVAGFPDSWQPILEEAREEVTEALEPDRICLVARLGEQILGWIGGISQYSHAWELHPLVVREDARGKGVGRALVTALEERVRERGALTLYLGTDDDGPIPRTSAGGVDLFSNVLSHAANLESIDHAAGFYRRLGYEVVGLIPDANGPGKPDVLMAKRIALDMP
jgi:aminoglycoside 6'-N-acetyltransferase I